MIRFLNSSSWVRSGMARVCGADRKGAASAIENLYLSAIALKTIAINGAWPCFSWRRCLQQERRGSFLLSPGIVRSRPRLNHLRIVQVCVVN
jgi:hypothetical protein